MNLAKLMEMNNVVYKEKEYEPDIRLFKVGSNEPTNVVEMHSPNSTFKIDRDLFYYLSHQKEDYSFCLVNEKEGKIFYVEFKNKNNWLKSSFERCDKEELFFGKIVLNNKVDCTELLERLKRY